MIKISCDFEIDPLVITNMTIVDTDDYVTEKMPRGEGQGGEKGETDTDRLSSSRNLQPVVAGVDISRETETTAGEQESFCRIF